MTTTQASRGVHLATVLSEDATALLPARRPFALIVLASLAAGFGLLVLSIVAVPSHFVEGPHSGDLGRLLLNLAPWVVTLPWLRHLDLSRVGWFFLCLAFGPLAGIPLVSIATHRAFSLPYRDWSGSWWHLDRARVIPGSTSWVLVPEAEAGPQQLSTWARRLYPVERWSWVVLMVAAVPLLTWDESLGGIGAVWAVCVLLLAFVPMVGTWIGDRRRRAAPAD